MMRRQSRRRSCARQTAPIGLPTRQPFVGIKSYADSGILYELQLWVKSDEYLSACFAVNEAVKRCFEEDGISFRTRTSSW